MAAYSSSRSPEASFPTSLGRGELPLPPGSVSGKGAVQKASPWGQWDLVFLVGLVIFFFFFLAICQQNFSAKQELLGTGTYLSLSLQDEAFSKCLLNELKSS